MEWMLHFDVFDLISFTKGQIDRGDWIHRLYLCRGVRLDYPNQRPGYDTNQSDGEPTVLLCLGLVAPDRVYLWFK